ncbi:hypothetical protein K2X30_05445 [bacterium]|jgi:hypothetical protein|nr:hypothetical protein [bacterium]
MTKGLMRGVSFLFFISVAAAGLTSCSGYRFQSSKDPLIAKQGVRRVYVAPLVNDTYKVGIENLVYNHLVKIIAAGGQVELVSSPQAADAVLTGLITRAEYGSSASNLANALYPSKLLPRLAGPGDRSISTEYIASLSCQFTLERRVVTKADEKKVLWQGGFGRSKPFPGNNRLDVFGTTSALINESEFERTLSVIAESMMGDLHESMLAMF